MAEKINRIEVQTLAKNGAELVEVLGAKGVQLGAPTSGDQYSALGD